DQAGIRENAAKLSIDANIRVAEMPVLARSEGQMKRLKAPCVSPYLPRQIRAVISLKRRSIQESLDRPGRDARGKIKITEARRLLLGDKGWNVERIGLIDKVEIVESHDHQARLACLERLRVFGERNKFPRGCRGEREHKAAVSDKTIFIHQ